MEIAQMGRGQGKTLYLIKKSAELQSPIICYSEKQKQLIKEKAEDKNLDIPDPIIFRFSDWKNGLKGKRFENGLLIDDMDYILERLFENKINIATVTCEVYKYINIDEKVK